MPVEANLRALVSLQTWAPEQPGAGRRQGGQKPPGPGPGPGPCVLGPAPLAVKASRAVPSKLGDRAGLARLKRRRENKRRPCGLVWQEPVAGRRAGKGRQRREGCGEQCQAKLALSGGPNAAPAQ